MRQARLLDPPSSEPKGNLALPTDNTSTVFYISKVRAVAEQIVVASYYFWAEVCNNGGSFQGNASIER